jgi:hypothetical protein
MAPRRPWRQRARTARSVIELSGVVKLWGMGLGGRRAEIGDQKAGRRRIGWRRRLLTSDICHLTSDLRAWGWVRAQRSSD